MDILALAVLVWAIRMVLLEESQESHYGSGFGGVAFAVIAAVMALAVLFR